VAAGVYRIGSKLQRPFKVDQQVLSAPSHDPASIGVLQVVSREHTELPKVKSTHPPADISYWWDQS